jgi:hypothetical protein
MTWDGAASSETESAGILCRAALLLRTPTLPSPASLGLFWGGVAACKFAWSPAGIACKLAVAGESICIEDNPPSHPGQVPICTRRSFLRKWSASASGKCYQSTRSCVSPCRNIARPGRRHPGPTRDEARPSTYLPSSGDAASSGYNFERLWEVVHGWSWCGDRWKRV